MGKQSAEKYVFGEKHREYMRRAALCTINVAEGAVRAGKTVDNVFVFAAELERSADRFHLASGSTLGNAKLNIGDCNGLGLENIFRGRSKWGKYRGNECMIVQTAMGEKVILFAGGKNADAYKRIRGNSYGMWIATEINLHADSFIREAFNRQLAAVHRKVFWDLNPSAPNSLIYREYIDRYAETGEENFFNYARFTIRDNPVISPERLREIEAQYDKASIWYRRDILGERCAAEGVIYHLFANDRERFTVKSVDASAVEFINIGVDFGGNRSKTTFVAAAFLRDGMICIVKDHAVSGGKGEIDSPRINEELRRFMEELRRDFPGVSVRYVFCDSEAQYLINGLRRSLRGCGTVISDCAKKRIRDRIAFVNSMMAAGKFTLLERCGLVADGLACAVWDDSGEDKRLDDFTSDIDILDAMEYAIERYMKR